MNDKLPDQLDRLPTELKYTVARYVTALNDRKSLVLVNKAWSEVVLPFLWENFNTDLTQTGTRQVMRLAHPKSNILKHVRMIRLTRSITGDVDHLPLFLAAIPRGQLRGFKSASSTSLSTLILLLRLHPRLEEIDIPQDSAFDNAFKSPWTQGCFSGLRSIVVAVGSFTNEGLQRLWDECSNLVHLELKRLDFSSFLSRRPPTTEISESAFLSSAKRTSPSSLSQPNDSAMPLSNALRLEYLRIENVVLPQSLTTMLQRIDVLTLQELTLDAFAGASGLLESMALQFTKGNPGLRTLCISHLPAQTSAAFTTSLFLLLSSFRGLRSLLIQCVDCDKLDMDGIIQHSDTLEIIYFINGGIHRQSPGKSFDASDLQKLATGCLKVQQLCLNLYEIDDDRNESDVLESQPGVPYTPNEFEQALTAIAGMPKLQILRFTNPPNYRKVFQRPNQLVNYFQRNLRSGVERYAFQARAEGIIGYLGKHGTNLKILAFSPIEKLQKANSPDKHGHVWPEYYYYRERMTNNKGTDVAVARPLANWKEELSGARILEEFS